MTTSFPASLLYLTESDAYVHKIKGVKFKFLPLSVKSLFAARPFLGPLSAFLTVSFMDKSPANAVVTERVTDIPPESNEDMGVVATDKTTVGAIDPGLYSEKRAHLEATFSRALEELTDTKAQRFLAGLIRESVGDDLEDKLGEEEALPEALSFLMALPLPVFLEFTYGLYKANEGALGKLLRELEAKRAGKTSSTSSSPSPKPVTEE